MSLGLFCSQCGIAYGPVGAGLGTWLFLQRIYGGKHLERGYEGAGFPAQVCGAACALQWLVVNGYVQENREPDARLTWEPVRHHANPTVRAPQAFFEELPDGV